MPSPRKPKKARSKAASPVHKPVFLKPSPWATAWFHPRQTVRTILSKGLYHHGFYTIGFLIGFNRLLELAGLRHWGENLKLWLIVAGCMILGWPIGFLYIYIQGWLYGIVCRALGGEGRTMQTTTAVAWGNITYLVSMVLNLLVICFVGQSVYTRGFDINSVGLFEAGVMIFAGLGFLLNSAWHFVLLTGTLTEVHKFKWWRAALAVLIFYAVGILFYWLSLMVKG